MNSILPNEVLEFQYINWKLRFEKTYTLKETSKVQKVKFELGKCYEHSSGGQMKIVGVADTTVYGVGYVSETPEGNYSIIGMTEENSVNWTEISNDKWMKNFNKCEKEFDGTCNNKSCVYHCETLIDGQTDTHSSQGSSAEGFFGL